MRINARRKLVWAFALAAFAAVPAGAVAKSDGGSRHNVTVVPTTPIFNTRVAPGGIAVIKFGMTRVSPGSVPTSTTTIHPVKDVTILSCPGCKNGPGGTKIWSTKTGHIAIKVRARKTMKVNYWGVPRCLTAHTTYQGYSAVSTQLKLCIRIAKAKVTDPQS